MEIMAPTKILKQQMEGEEREGNERVAKDWERIECKE
jgi:hypothetical protein